MWKSRVAPKAVFDLSLSSYGRYNSLERIDLKRGSTLANSHLNGALLYFFNVRNLTSRSVDTWLLC